MIKETTILKIDQATLRRMDPYQRIIFVDLLERRGLDADPVVGVLWIDQQEGGLRIGTQPFDLLAMLR